MHHSPFLRISFILLSILLLNSCLRPLDSDFVNEGPGLEDNEMLWIVRIPDGQLALQEVKPTIDRERFAEKQNFMFKEALPKLIEDVLNGTVPCYLEYGDEKPVENVRERLQQFGGTKLNYAPLTRAVGLFSIVNVNEVQYISTPKFLTFTWEEPGSAKSGRVFAGVYVDSLPRSKYLVKTSQGRIPLRDYLRLEWFHYEPVYIRTNTLEYTPRSHAEANYLRDNVKMGKWKSLEWEDGALNISGKNRIQLDPEKVLEYAGSYFVARYDGSFRQEIFFTAQKDFLLADWEERFELSRIFPFHQNSFFSHSGDIYLFERDEDLMRLYVITENDTLYGQRSGY